MELNYKSFGTGDPVIILHGLFGTLDNWQTIAKKLAQEYTVYIIDQRNHGRSPHEEEFNYPIMAEDLHEFLESNWIYKAHIIGHSMGGKTAMQFALEYPDMVDKLIIVDIGTQGYEGGHQLIFDALFALNLDQLESRKDADVFLTNHIENFGIRQFLLKNLTRDKGGKYRWKMNLDAIYKNYQNILAPVTGDEPYEGDVLFVKGGQSDYITTTSFTATTQIFPQAHLKTIKGAGHWVHAEAPKEIISIIHSFLEQD